MKAEKELLEWAKKKTQNIEEKPQEKEKKEVKQEEDPPKYKFDDVNYMKSLKEIGASVSSSVETGLLRSRSSNSTLEQDVAEPPSKKRRKNVWYAITF